MKLQFQKYNWERRDALHDMIRAGLNSVQYDSSFSTEIVALDGDFLPTTNVSDARWLYTSSYYGYAIVRINNDGSMTHIINE